MLCDTVGEDKPRGEQRLKKKQEALKYALEHKTKMGQAERSLYEM